VVAFLVRLAVGQQHDELALLFGVPVALLGVGLGRRAGLAGAGVAIGLLFLRAEIQDVELTALDVAIRAVGFVALGAGLGHMSDRRRRDLELLDAVFESADDALYVKDRDGRYRLMNRRGAQMLRRPLEAILGHTDVDLLGPAGASALGTDRAVLASGRPERFESELRLDEDTRVFSSVKSALRDRMGRVAGIVGVTRDVTDTRRTQADLLATEERFRHLVESVEDYAIVSLDPEGRITSWNAGAERITGWRSAEVLGRHVGVLCADEERAAGLPEAKLRQAAECGRFAAEQRKQRKDGSSYWASVTLTAQRDEAGGLRGFAEVTRDISARRRTQEELRAAEARFRTAFEEAPMGIMLADLQGTCFQANAALAAMLGTRPDALLGMAYSELCAPDEAATLERMVTELAAGERAGWQGEHRLRAVDGRAFWALVSLSAVRDEEGRPAYYIVQAQDVTERRRAEDALAHQALHDPLTGLPNRVLLLDRLEHALERQRREGSLAALLFVDLDRFKPVNDSLGHAAGDLVLSEVARRLGEAVRAGDTVARLGGDEFVLFAERLEGGRDAVIVAERAAAAIREPISVEAHTVHLDASIGIAFAGGEDPEELLGNADAAMYEAKQQRTNHALYDERMRVHAHGRVALEADLRRALAAREIAVHYQTQVDLATGALVGVEALARWEHPKRGLVLPGDFVPLAEETGLIAELGDQVLETACRDAARWARSPARPLVVSVNLSASQFAGRELATRVATVLDHTGLDPALLCLEITETAVMRDVQAARRALDALKTLGVRIAIDDFGTGYSSLSYLTRFPVDVLKIDRLFVQGLERAEEAALVGAIIAMGHALGVTIVAEGIETDAQRDELSWLTCDVGQGFRFGRAQEREAIASLLRSGRRFGSSSRQPRPALTAGGV